MRVGFDATPLLGPRTGIGWYTSELISAVAEQSPDDELVLFPISWRTARALEAPPRPNVAVVRRFAPARPLWALWRRVPYPPLEWYVDCDVFHGTNFLAPPARRARVVVTVHDLSFVRHPETCLPATRRFAELLPPVLRRADAIVAVSRFTRDEIADWMPSVAGRVHVVYPGPHRRPPGSDPALPPGPPFVLALGALDPRKNLPLLLDALVILRKWGEELRLVVTGPSSPLVDAAGLLRERDLGPADVVLTGYADDARLSALLRAARLVAVPSLYEGFGMPVVEAMEAGTPVVAARAGAIPETAGDAALLVDPADPEGLADAIRRVASDSELRRRLVEDGRRRAARFTWPDAARQALALYRGALSRSA